jgi:triosephosphate isomerase
MDTRFVIGNWKMKITTMLDAQVLVRSIEGLLRNPQRTRTVVCPSSVHIVPVMNVSHSKVEVGAQNCHVDPRGSFTGEISPTQLRDLGVSYVILGHSEQRDKGETDESVRHKVRSVMRAGMKPVVCIGELERDDSYEYREYIKEQVLNIFEGISPDELKKILIAYEPRWATGKDALRECTPVECLEVSQIVRATFKEKYGGDMRNVTLLYGGSVDAKNARNYCEEGGVQGVLVGRASLEADEFVDIVRSIDRPT